MNLQPLLGSGNKRNTKTTLTVVKWLSGVAFRKGLFYTRSPDQYISLLITVAFYTEIWHLCYIVQRVPIILTVHDYVLAFTYSTNSFLD